MKKQVFFLILLFPFLSFNVDAQEKQSSKIKFKTYYNFNRTNYFQTFNFTTGSYEWIQPEIINNQAGEFSLAAIIQNKTSQSHEFEIMPFSIQHSTLNEVEKPMDEYNWQVSGQKTTTLNSRFRYQKNYLYHKNKCDFLIGLFGSANYFAQHYKPQTSVDFQRSFTQIAFVVGLTPGIEIAINEKMVWSVDVPIGIAGLNMRQLNTTNPSLIQKERKQTVLNGEFWQQGFQVRLGFGFLL